MRTLHFPTQTARSAAAMGRSTVSTYHEYLALMLPSQQMDRTAAANLHGAFDWEDEQSLEALRVRYWHVGLRWTVSAVL